eukprot:349634-Chlamydomonas_euryale.AAC.2
MVAKVVVVVVMVFVLIMVFVFFLLIMVAVVMVLVPIMVFVLLFLLTMVVVVGGGGGGRACVRACMHSPCHAASQAVSQRVKQRSACSTANPNCKHVSAPACRTPHQMCPRPLPPAPAGVPPTGHVCMLGVRRRRVQPLHTHAPCEGAVAASLAGRGRPGQPRAAHGRAGAGGKAETGRGSVG